MLFSELKLKDVINITDGRRLGRPTDLLLNSGACIEALIVPSQAGPFAVFRGEKEGVAIPWSCVKRIGDDVILVDVEL